MAYKIPGILNKSKDNAQFIKGLGLAMGKDMDNGILKDVVFKKKKQFSPRPNAHKPHRQIEKSIQKDIIEHLRMRGCICGKVKAEAGVINGIRLKSNLNFVGVPDILCFSWKGMWFIEVKLDTYNLKCEQKKFQELCQSANINHIVATSVDDCWVVYK